LFYAINQSGSFETQVVSEGYFYGPVDLALDPAGQRLIAYHDHQDQQFDPGLGDEVVAVNAGGAWELVTVSDDGHDGWDNSIVVGDDGFWRTAAVDPSQFGGSGAVKYEFGTTIQLDPDDSPAIAYYSDRDDRLVYALFASGEWIVEVVDDNGDAGRYATLALDSSGVPHIAYYVVETPNSGEIRHSWLEGSEWMVEVVGTLEDVQMGHIGARKITSLAFDSDGGLHLAYTDRSQLVYAQRTDQEWLAQQVVAPGERMLG
jgi:hypothetical protein